MAGPLIECVPNFSEGNDTAKVSQIVATMQVEGVRLLDWSLDKAHNRSVVTIAGTSAGVVEAAVGQRLIEIQDVEAQVRVADRVGRPPRHRCPTPRQRRGPAPWR